MIPISIPAPVAVSPVTPAITTPATPAVTADTSARQDATTPPLEIPAGQETEQASGAEPPVVKEELSQGELKRRERNRERWQQMKETARRAESAEAELYRIKYAKQPDFSQIVDPQDELAERTAWKVKQAHAENEASRAQQDRRANLNQAWSETVEDMRVRMPDFDTVVTDRTPVHERAAPFIVESEKGGEIAYFLGKNPAIARDLYDKFESAPARALIELGRIEARLSAPPAKTVSTAPKPAQLLGGGVNPSGFDAATASVSDFQAQLRKSKVLR